MVEILCFWLQWPVVWQYDRWGKTHGLWLCSGRWCLFLLFFFYKNLLTSLTVSVFCEAIFFETSAPVAKDLRRSIAHFADSNLKVNIVQENVGRGWFWRLGKLHLMKRREDSTFFFYPQVKSIKVLEILLFFLEPIFFLYPTCQENSYQHLLRGKNTLSQLKKALILLDPPYDSGNSYFTWNLFMLRRLQETWPQAGCLGLGLEL